ncbi:MAG: hypothetical protein MUO54_16940, partial [Anaerolineales bacterium]|nr:hypothetical protein [Anaerolineales bacterium]
LSYWLQEKSTVWVVIGTLVIMLLFTILVLPSQAEASIEHTGSSTAPDTSLYYSAEDLYKMVENYGPEGRRAYISARWTFDLIFPLVYVSFLAMGISWFSKQLIFTSKAWNLVNLLPLLSGILDYLENSATSLVMYLYPIQLMSAAFLASIFTLLKWVSIFLSFVGYIYFSVSALLSWLSGKNDKN